MPVTVRTTQADISNYSTWTANSELKCISVMVEMARLLVSWPASGPIVFSQASIDGLDNSFESVGNRGGSLILRYMVAAGGTGYCGTRDSSGTILNSLYNTFRINTEARGVQWILGLETADPNHIGDPIDYPYPRDVTMRTLMNEVYDFTADYLTATTTTTRNGVTFGACRCSNPVTTHSKRIHTHNVSICKPTGEFAEMTIGYGSNATSAALIWNALDGLGTTPYGTSASLRAQAICEEWKWTVSMVYGHLGNIVRGSIATGGTFSNWTYPNQFIQWITDPAGGNIPGEWVTCFRTDLEGEYATGGNSTDRTQMVTSKNAGVRVGAQTASESRQPWSPSDFTGGDGMVAAFEHAMDGTTVTLSGNEIVGYSIPATRPYGVMDFVEVPPGRIGAAANSIPAIGKWPAGTYTGKQILLTGEQSIESRTTPFSPWSADEPEPPATGGWLTGAYAG